MDKKEVAKKGDYTLTVGDKSCQLREPNRSEYGRVISMVTPMAGREPDFVKAGEILLNSCWVSGDHSMKNHENVKLNVTACINAIGLLDLYESELKKN